MYDYLINGVGCYGAVCARELMDAGAKAFVSDKRNSVLYQVYKKLADVEAHVIFSGRLGEYKYYDMDQVIVVALEKSKELIRK